MDSKHFSRWGKLWIFWPGRPSNNDPETFTEFYDFESDQAVVDVDLAPLLEDSGQIGVVHPDGGLVRFVFVALCRHHAHVAALFQLHLLLHLLHARAHREQLESDFLCPLPPDRVALLETQRGTFTPLTNPVRISGPFVSKAMATGR